MCTKQMSADVFTSLLTHDQFVAGYIRVCCCMPQVVMKITRQISQQKHSICHYSQNLYSHWSLLVCAIFLFGSFLWGFFLLLFYYTFYEYYSWNPFGEGIAWIKTHNVSHSAKRVFWKSFICKINCECLLWGFYLVCSALITCLKEFLVMPKNFIKLS